MKKNAKVVAKDVDSRMEITIRFQSQPYYLTKDEVKNVVRHTAEEIAKLVAANDYGLSNVKITV